MGYGGCNDDCPGYLLDPKPGHLFSGESQADFGYPTGWENTCVQHRRTVTSVELEEMWTPSDAECNGPRDCVGTKQGCRHCGGANSASVWLIGVEGGEK